MDNLLDELKSIASDPQTDALEKMAEEVEQLKQNQSKFANLIARYIESNNSRMDRIATSIEILQNKSVTKINNSRTENNQTNESGSLGTQAQEGDNKQN